MRYLFLVLALTQGFVDFLVEIINWTNFKGDPLEEKKHFKPKNYSLWGGRLKSLIKLNPVHHEGDKYEGTKVGNAVFEVSLHYEVICLVSFANKKGSTCINAFQ